MDKRKLLGVACLVLITAAVGVALSRIYHKPFGDTIIIISSTAVAAILAVVAGGRLYRRK